MEDERKERLTVLVSHSAEDMSQDRDDDVGDQGRQPHFRFSDAVVAFCRALCDPWRKNALEIGFLELETDSER